MQRLQRKIVLRAKNARKRIRTIETSKKTTSRVSIKKKTKPKKLQVQPKPRGKREKPPGMGGRLIMGHKSILLDERQHCVDFYSNKIPPISRGRYVYQSGQHRLVAYGQKKGHSTVVGTRGHCKAYIQTSKTGGIIIFHEHNMVERTYLVWEELVKRDLAPLGKLIPMNFNLSIQDCMNKWRKTFKGTQCISVPHINFPTFLFDLQNDDHCKVMYGEKQFHTPDELSSSKYWCGAIDDLKAKYEFMYKEDRFKDHPKFTSEEYVRFCDKISNLLQEESVLRQARPSKMKWGNVLYCMNAKKWYWVDC